MPRKPRTPEQLAEAGYIEPAAAAAALRALADDTEKNAGDGQLVKFSISFWYTPRGEVHAD